MIRFLYLVFALFLFTSSCNSEKENNHDKKENIPQETITHENITYENITHENITHENITYENITYENIIHEIITFENIISENIPFIDVGAANRVDTSKIATNVNFTGRAVGQASSNSATVGLDGKATLRFDSASGISSLGATFGNWYDINVQDNATGTIVFSNYKNKEDLVKFGIQPDANGNIIMSGANMNVNYYAPNPENGIPTEANGLLQFQEHETDIKLDIAFGAK